MTIGAVSVVGAAPAAADEHGMRIEADTTYVLDPDAELVRVSVNLRLTNLVPDRGLTYYYFDQVGVWAPAEATNVTARRSGGGTLSTGRESTDDPEFEFLTVKLSPVLRHGSPQRIELSYELPSQPPRSDGWTRASGAYTLFPIFPIGDPGLSGITVIIPDVFDEIHIGGDGIEMRRVRADGVVHYEASEIEANDWFAMVSARSDSLLDERVFTAGEVDVTLRYWPGDEEWADFAEATAAEGIPLLIELIGQPWPGGSELEIIESSVPHVYGAGGWFDSHHNVIEVGDALNPDLMLHELAHGWFNHDRFAHAWLREGFADLYAYLALVELDGHEPSQEPKPSSIDEEVPLAEWEYVFNALTELDQYGYETSYWLLHEIYTEIGDDAMTAVLAGVFNRTMPYLAGERMDRVGSSADWQRMLDLFDEVAGFDAQSLYEDFVVAGDDLARLVERADAREVYADLVGASGGWGAPLQVRRAMTDWNFVAVADAIAESAEVLAARDALLADLATFGVTELPRLAEEYQSARQISDVLGTAAAYADAITVLAVAADQPDGLTGQVQKIGLFGAPVDDDLLVAAAFLVDGEVDQAHAAAEAIVEVVEEARLVGGVVAGQMVLCVALLALAIALRVRRRRLASAATTPTDLPGELDPDEGADAAAVTS